VTCRWKTRGGNYGTIQDLQLTIEAQRQAAARLLNKQRLEAARLQAEEVSFSKNNHPEKVTVMGTR